MKNLLPKNRLSLRLAWACLVLFFTTSASFGQTLFDCSGIPVWNSGVIYSTAGDTVQHLQKVYVNKWWTTGEDPSQSGQWGVWRYLGDCITDPQPPAAPTNLAGTAAGVDVINLSWTDNANNEDLFRLQTSADGVAWGDLATLAANQTNYVHTGLTASSTHYYRVRAENSVGNSAWSNVAIVTTDDPPTPPLAPANLVATAAGSAQIDLTWADNSDNEDNFDIERASSATGPWSPIASVGANVTAYSNTGLAASTTYFYRVKASNVVGSSAYSNVDQATTTQGGTPPAAPSNLTATAVSSSAIDLAWTDNSADEDSFVLQSSLDGTTWSDVATLPANTVSYSNAGLTASTLYYYQVKAVNAYGSSPFSNVASDSTLDGGGGCAGIPQYPEGRGSYVAGDQVQNVGNVYEVREWPREAWANSTSSAYEPGVGYAWEDAWTFVKICDAPPVPPAAPSQLNAVPMSDSKINLSWTDNSDNEDLFSIERAASATGPWTPIATVNADLTSYSNTGLSPLTQYHYRVRAENAYGNSDYTNVASATTLDTSSADLPDRIVVGYWHNWNAAAQGGYIRLIDVPDYYNVIVVAFVEKVGEDGTIRFVPDTEVVSEAQFRQDIVAAQASGKKILISIGGQNNHLILETTAMRDNFANSMIATIEDWGFDGLDIDLESSSMVLAPGDTDLNNPTTPGIVNLIDACRTVYNHFGPGFMLTAAPETAHVQGGYGSYSAVYGAYLPWLHNLRDILTYVHVQYYNSGTMDGLDGGVYAVGTADFIVAMTEMLTYGFPIARNPNNMFPPLREDQVAFGIPCAPGAAGSGYTPAAEVNKALDYLMTGTSFGGNYVLRNPAGYCNLRGAMTWSINWDYQENGASYAWARDVSAKLAAIPACTKSAGSVISNEELSIELNQNYPNPFDFETNISFNLEQASDVDIRVFDNLGKVVSIVTDKKYDAGVHTVVFDGAELASGIYYYQLTVGDEVQTKLMLKK